METVDKSLEQLINNCEDPYIKEQYQKVLDIKAGKRKAYTYEEALIFLEKVEANV